MTSEHRRRRPGRRLRRRRRRRREGRREDNCPTASNADQTNTDQGGAQPDGLGDACDPDDDGDGHADDVDNCPTNPNGGLIDQDRDGAGFSCDDPDPAPGPCANFKTGTAAADTLAGTAFGDFINGLAGNDSS